MPAAEAAPAAPRLVRHNPRSGRFVVHGFDHVEFWCGDASCTWRRFALGLGLRCVAKSDQSTGNATYASYVCRSHDVVFVFTAPYAAACRPADDAPPHPAYSQDAARAFTAAHGLGVRAVALRVADAAAAHAAALAGGAASVLPPTHLGAPGAPDACTIAEVELYGDVVLRLISRPAVHAANCDGDDAAPASATSAAVAATPHAVLPGYADCCADTAPRCYGLRRFDHVVGNVPILAEAVRRVAAFTGFHEFAEFTTADVGTVDSGLNSVVLASDCERVLLPLNEPTFGTRRKSQIQTYLEQNEGAGVQHLALKTDDMFATLRCMRAATEHGGFELLRAASADYYAQLPARLGPDAGLSAAQLAECEELGILVDRDDQGVLLQIFTKPLGDRPTVFVEIIQRVGCRLDAPPGAPPPRQSDGAYEQAPGCGGFGKGNFSELFRSIEAYEATLKA